MLRVRPWITPLGITESQPVNLNPTHGTTFLGQAFSNVRKLLDTTVCVDTWRDLPLWSCVRYFKRDFCRTSYSLLFSKHASQLLEESVFSIERITSTCNNGYRLGILCSDQHVSQNMKTKLITTILVLFVATCAFADDKAPAKEDPFDLSQNEKKSRSSAYLLSPRFWSLSVRPLSYTKRRTGKLPPRPMPNMHELQIGYRILSELALSHFMGRLMTTKGTIAT